MNANATASYREAFDRNLGLVTEAEQTRIREARVALPGLGGVGGFHLEALARLGIGHFHLADLDEFEVGNIHRQLGATMRTVGRPKVEVLAERARAINPEVNLRCFPKGISPRNIDAFLKDVDVVVDGMEFFRIDTRRMLYQASRRHRVPVVTAGPLGYGSALLVFLPDGPSFDEYFGMDDEMTHAELLTAHLLGHSNGQTLPIDPARVDLKRQRGPALGYACMLCAAVAAAETLKLLCGRGPVAAAPRGLYYDPYELSIRKLRPRPSLRHTIRGRRLRRMVFKRLPQLRELHEEERARRAAAPGPQDDTRCRKTAAPC